MLFLFLTSVVPLVVAKNELYMGHKVYNVKLTSQQQQENLNLLKADIIDYWIKPNFKYDFTGLAMVPPSHFSWFEERLDELEIDKEIVIEDVYEYLTAKESSVTKKVSSNAFKNEYPNETDGSDGEGDENDRNEENNVTGEDEIDGNETEETNFTDEDENGGNETEETNFIDEDGDGGDEIEETNVTDEDRDDGDETEETDVTDEDGDGGDETEETNATDEDGDGGVETEETNVTDEDGDDGDETEETNVTDEDGDGGDETEETNVTDEDDRTEEIDVTEESEEDDITFDFDGYYRYNTVSTLLQNCNILISNLTHSNGVTILTRYPCFQILNYIYKIRDAYEDSQTASIKVVEFASTDLNRPLVYLKLSRTGGEENKPIIVIEGGINPRQWITIPSAFKIVEEVLESNQARYLDNFDWIVVPVVNPDGYEYTHTDLRLWEKNLSTKSNLGFICPGVNINRNFNIDWSRADSSSSACSHLYAGTGANSEIETQLIQSIVDTYRDRISMYISLQNGGGYISYPWQYEFAASGTFRQNHLLAMGMVAAMQDEYHLDIASVAYGDRASGTSSDYARINDVLYAFNIDIVRRGTDGVIVPENEIVDIVEDVWRAVAVAADNLIN
ncbi:carboxypeptidase B-like [Cydia amplana]|uniref:carboxypeptidase B-like n=1 Tax=Cydia amplana TaxID=1869771 RepID=UPI002FE554DE